MYFVYLLQSIQNGRYYIGQTANLNERLEKHNSAYVKSTKPYIPWKLIGNIPVESRKEALPLEKKIKNLKKREAQLRYFMQNSPRPGKFRDGIGQQNPDRNIGVFCYFKVFITFTYQTIHWYLLTNN